MFLQGLKPNLKDPNFVTEVYHEFAMTEGLTKLVPNPTSKVNLGASQVLA